MNVDSNVGDDEINKMIANLTNNSNSPQIDSVSDATAQSQPVFPVEDSSNTQNPPQIQNVKTANNVQNQIENSAANTNNKFAPQKNLVASEIKSENNLPESANKLEEIKVSAIHELRPLVDKLNLPPEDKFDTLLLLIRSTDDSSLIPMAHQTATSIPDEARRAQALLEIIKEIDFFSQNSAK